MEVQGHRWPDLKDVFVMIQNLHFKAVEYAKKDR